MTNPSHFMTEGVQIALEVTRGTPVTPMTLALPLLEPGLVPSDTSHLGEVRAGWSFPSRTVMVPLGRTHAFSVTVDANAAIIRDLVLLATKRTANKLPSTTVVQNQNGIEPGRYFGCVVERLRLGWTRGPSPDLSAVLACQLDFQCIGFEPNAGAMASLTAPNGNRFTGRHSTVAVHSTAQNIIGSCELVIANKLGFGSPDPASAREFICDGDEMPEIRVTRQFYDTFLRGLLVNQTEATSNSIAFATGTANETLTFSMGKLRIGTRTRGNMEGAPSEDVTLQPYHTGAAHQLLPTFGAAIPATVLGL